MQQTRRKVILIAVFSPLLMASRCPANASVDLTHVERYQSNFGVFDAPQFGLGDILDLDTAALKGARIYTVLPQQGDSTIEPLISSTAIVSSLDMDVHLDANVKARDIAAVEATVKAYAASHTAFELKGFRRINLTDPVARLNLTPSKVADLRARLATPGAQLYLIVGSICRSTASRMD